MILVPPKPTIGQKFGANAVALYNGQGLKGHTGVDYGFNYGEPVRSSTDSYCYSIVNKDNPDPSKYRAVFTLVEEGDIAYEISYGHCSEIYVRPNEYLKQGDIIAAAGNTGDVYQLGVPISKEDRLAGSRAGSHLHFQVRLCKKVRNLSEHNHYLYDGFGLFVRDGYFYEIVDYNEGYNGCIDPEPFFKDTKLAPQTPTSQKASESITTFASTLTGWKKDILATLAKWLQSLGY